MTFDLVRIGWPNTAAILALAATMPIVALTTCRAAAATPRPRRSRLRQFARPTGMPGDRRPPPIAGTVLE